MTDQELEQAKKAPRRHGISSIWIVPIIAMAIGGWMIYQHLAGIGPEVTLEMTSADGIQAEKTMIKARNVEVGRVKSMRLSDDLSHVIINAQMEKDAERLLKSDSRFWVVKPRINREGISGLGTLWSGAYIELLPGQAEETKTHFEVLDEPPIAQMNAEGLRVQLRSDIRGRLSVGDPIIYRGFNVGRIETAEFDIEDREMDYQLFIEDKYRNLVTKNTRFWSASGFSFAFDSGGMKVDMGSVETILDGGITFDVPENLPLGETVDTDARFKLYADKSSAFQASFDKYLEYVLLIDDTVRGLNNGASVEYRGVRIGTVMEVPYEFTPERVKTMSDIKIPVLIRIEPQRLDSAMTETELTEWRERYSRLFDNGLRAALKTGNLLTGAVFVDIAFHEAAKAFEETEFAGKTVFPSVPSRLTQLDQRLSQFMDKLNSIEVKPLLDKLNANLENSEAMLTDLRELSNKVGEILDSENVQALPGDMRQTLDKLNNTLEGFTPSSPAYKSLTETLQRLDKLLNDFQPFVETLNEQPNALIFNKQPAEDPQPRAKPSAEPQP